MKRVSQTCIAVLVTVLATGLVLADTIEERFEKTIPLRDGGFFSLSNKNGSIEISSWDREEVRIEALKKVKSSSRRHAKEAMEELRIDIDTRGDDEIIIETDYPRSHREGDGIGGVLDAILGSGKKPQISVSYKITLPEKVDVNVSTTNGSIELEDIEGETQVGSTNGKVYMSHVKGFIDVSTTNGRIELIDIDGGLDAGTTNGSVEVEYSSRADIRDNISVRTTNGGIEIVLPEDIDADLRARTTNGHIDTDFPVTVRGRHGKKNLSGQINDGGPLIELKTTNGSIHIRSRRVRI